MRFVIGCLIAMLTLGTTAAPAQAQLRFRVGQIIIVGNTETPDYLIRSQVTLYPGMQATMIDVRRAEARLRQLPWFRPGATVTVLESEHEFHDVLVHVQESEWNWLLVPAYEVFRIRYAYDLVALEDVVNRVREWRPGR